MKNKIIEILVLILVFMAVFNKGGLFLRADVPEGRNMVRVGLTKEFYNKTSVNLNNSELRMGFSKDDSYYVTDILRSKNGISISRDYGTYDIYGGSFSTYAKAASEAAGIKALKKSFTIIPALTGLDKNGGGIWTLYEAGQNKSSKYFLAVTVGGSKFLVDAEKAGANPQFEALNELDGVDVEGTSRYRGRIEVGTYGKRGVTPVNAINLEDYIRGSVPLEMSHTWPSAALKAQAVCARSFGAAVSGFGSDSDIKKGYKLTNTISHQSYGGMNVERREADKAVRATENEFVTYKNRVVKTTYFSTSGGYTEDSENVWGKRRAWLRAVPDPYENKPEKKPWKIKYTKKQLSNLFKGKNLGEIEELKVIKRSESGRALALLVKGSRGKAVLRKQEIRKTFGLYSTKIRVYNSSDFIFRGSGYGHGVGLSQSGARGMAEAGYGYKKILMYYFTDAEVH